MDCETGCTRPAKEGALCYACARAKRRNGTTTRKKPERGTRHKSPKAMTLEAIEAYNDSDPMDDDAHRTAWARLRTAWRRYFKRTGLNTVRSATDTTSRG